MAARGVTSGPPAAVEFGVKKNNDTVEGPCGLVYTARLPLSSATLNWLADLVRGHLNLDPPRDSWSLDGEWEEVPAELG
jgi:hypothetical protein